MFYGRNKLTICRRDERNYLLSQLFNNGAPSSKNLLLFLDHGLTEIYSNTLHPKYITKTNIYFVTKIYDQIERFLLLKMILIFIRIITAWLQKWLLRYNNSNLTNIKQNAQERSCLLAWLGEKSGFGANSLFRSCWYASANLHNTTSLAQLCGSATLGS